MPHVFAELGAGAFLRSLPCYFLELAVVPVAAGEAEQDEARGQQAAVGQVVDGRDELLAGEVAGDAEDDERARVRYAGEAAVPRVAQRVFREVGHAVALSLSCCCTAAMSSVQEASNFSTPSSSRTRTTSS